MTTPSDDWREGEPGEFEPANPLLQDEDSAGGEDYNPAVARPDLDDRANEADVVEQAYEVQPDDEDDDAEI